MNKFRFSVIVPIYNEENIVEKSIRRFTELFKKYADYEIILGDNGSTDSTPEKCRSLAKRFKHVKYIRIEEKGIGLALKEMIRRARFENIIFLPIDFSVNMKFIDEALPLLSRYDIIVGSKRVKGAVDDRPLDRRLITLILNLLVNTVFGLDIKDTQCVKAFKKSKIKRISQKVGSKNAFFDVELLLLAKRSRLKMIEIPVICHDHRKSKFNILREFFKIIFRMAELYR